MKITIYTDSIYDGHRKITDKKEVAETIKKHISHLGKFSIYCEPEYKELSKWKKILRHFGSGY